MKYIICLFSVLAIINCSMPGGFTKVEINQNDARLNKVIMTVKHGIDSFMNIRVDFQPIARKFELI